ncbi:HD domain-containing phosphohydrolase [Lyngbya confervoides]|uniref:Histidine kinase n=1 Tax=Lyngbya confervoides BDU141951 TaxID=1574623 RepID=A0ABD4T5N1_9CYAN|nr:HD domain-containing phosphohydrolase [Lyngbya confervoides]MCM1983855.1 histidine kinase [Lyngbya confervoides BDU141951]
MQPESTLNQLKQLCPSGQLPSSYGVYFKNTLVALCHALEDHILDTCSSDPHQQPLVLVTFQQGKWYLQEADRYWDLAACCRHVVIAAVQDSGLIGHRTSQREQVSLCPLDPQDSLVNEWNLVILAPQYAAMVLCHELDEAAYHPQSIPGVDAERKFYGLWTFERELVEAAAHILIERMRPYSSQQADQLQAYQAAIAQVQRPGQIDLSNVVTRIVSYLQTSQEKLVTVSRQTQEMWELEGQALKLNRNLAASKLQAFLRMARRVDEQDTDNPVASLQVAALSETLGQLLDLSTLQLRRLRLAGLLFRIGLAEAPQELFLRPREQLDASIQSMWRDRSLLSARLLSSMAELAPITAIVRHFLEYWDGSGTPDGLKGEAIPIESRILGLVSYFQELTQARGDRPALGLGEALEQCRHHSASRFDPSLVDTLANVVRLVEMGLMELPNQPGQLPSVWVEDPLTPANAAAKSL